MSIIYVNFEDNLFAKQNNLSFLLQNVVNRNPVLSGRFHANILAVVTCKPCGAFSQIAGKGREPFADISGYSLIVCGSNTGNKKRFVNIYATADGINNF